MGPRLLWALVDAFEWCLAADMAVWLRRRCESAGITVWSTMLGGVVAGPLKLGGGAPVGSYRRRQARGSFEGIVALGQTTLTLSLFLPVGRLGLGGLRKIIPGTVSVVAGFIALMAMLSLWPVWMSRMRGRRGVPRVIGFGAGTPDRLLVRLFMHDDDPPKRGLKIERIKGVDGHDAVARVAERQGTLPASAAVAPLAGMLSTNVSSRAGLTDVCAPPPRHFSSPTSSPRPQITSRCHVGIVGVRPDLGSSTGRGGDRHA